MWNMKNDTDKRWVLVRTSSNWSVARAEAVRENPTRWVPASWDHDPTQAEIGDVVRSIPWEQYGCQFSVMQPDGAFAVNHGIYYRKSERAKTVYRWTEPTANLTGILELLPTAAVEAALPHAEALDEFYGRDTHAQRLQDALDSRRAVFAVAKAVSR